MSKDFYSKANSQSSDYMDMPIAPNETFRKTMFNPWIKTYKIPADAYVKITQENRFKYFRKRCPVCGKEIFGRPSEYPYYKMEGDKVAFVCEWCARLKCIKDDQIHKTMEDILADEFDD